MATVEVRVTTYKRPDLLKRCLNSLISQTFPDWQAYIFDDSPEQEGKLVLEDFQDPRLIYKPNKMNLGRAQNLDQAFYSKSFGDSEYAFVLEDDNYLYPNFISTGISNIQYSGVNICMINQEVRLEKNGTSIPQGVTSRGRWFQARTYEPIEICASLFYCEGISNGGLFWKTKAMCSNLQIGSWMQNSWYQEVLRTLQIEQSIYFEPQPLAAWTWSPPKETANPFSKFLSSPSKFSRLSQHVLIKLHKKYGDALIFTALEMANGDEDYLDFEQQLLNMLIIDYKFSYIKMPKRLFLLVRSAVRYYFFGRSFKHILNNISSLQV